MVSLFEVVDDNVRQGTVAFTQTLRLAKRQVAEDRLVEVAVTERLAALLLAAQYESRLHWLINHPDSRLTPADVEFVRNAGGLSKKWSALLRVSLAMRKNANDGTTYTADDIPTVLSKSERRRYQGINRVIREHLDVLIDLRNSLAHGEWNTALSKRADAINAPRTAKIQSLRLFRVVILANMLDHLWHALFDAQVTYWAFERDFERHYQGMTNAARRLERANESRWLVAMRKRYRHGRSAREALSTPPRRFLQDS